MTALNHEEVCFIVGAKNLCFRMPYNAHLLFAFRCLMFPNSRNRRTSAERLARPVIDPRTYTVSGTAEASKPRPNHID
jgi:hypothetical protein